MSKIEDAREALGDARAAFDEAAEKMSAAIAATTANEANAMHLLAQASSFYIAAKAGRERAETLLAEAEREEAMARPKGKRMTVAERAAQAICPECGGPVARKSKHGPEPTFCCSKHRTNFNNRAITDGTGVIAYLKAWRVDRGRGEIASISFARLCNIIDSLNDEDRKAGSPRADLYAAKLIARNLQTVDEARYGRRKRSESKAREEAAE